MGDNGFSKGLRCARCNGPRTNRSKRYCSACFGPAMTRPGSRKFNKGLRCMACGAPRANYSLKYCRDCYGPARGIATCEGQSVISPWETLPDGDRVRTLTTPE